MKTKIEYTTESKLPDSVMINSVRGQSLIIVGSPVGNDVIKLKMGDAETYVSGLQMARAIAFLIPDSGIVVMPKKENESV